MASSEPPPEKKADAQPAPLGMAALQVVCAHEETRELVALRKLFRAAMLENLRTTLSNIVHLFKMKDAFKAMPRAPQLQAEIDNQTELIDATLRRAGLQELCAERLEALLNDKEKFEEFADDVVQDRLRRVM